jgi:hypothetical protein
MHGSTRHFTVSGDAHFGSGSFFDSTRHTHGASWQYDECVRQSASLEQATADGEDDVALADGALDVVGVEDGPDPASVGATFGSEQSLSRIRSRIFCGAEGDRTPDLIHAMDALSQLSYSPIEEVRNSYFGLGTV